MLAGRMLSRAAATSMKGKLAPVTCFKRSSSNVPVLPGSDNEFESQDGQFEMFQVTPEDDRWDPTGRVHHYAVQGAAQVMYATFARLWVCKIVTSLSQAKDSMAAGSLEMDIGAVPEGYGIIQMFRGRPVFINHRSANQIAEAQADDDSPLLKDPQRDADRVWDPKFLVQIGVCTHLGCVPTFGVGNYRAWFCPCHGSHYDFSGRIRKGPAPLNLEVPEYTLNGTILKLGD